MILNLEGKPREFMHKQIWNKNFLFFVLRYLKVSKAFTRNIFNLGSECLLEGLKRGYK